MATILKPFKVLLIICGQLVISNTQQVYNNNKTFYQLYLQNYCIRAWTGYQLIVVDQLNITNPSELRLFLRQIDCDHHHYYSQSDIHDGLGAELTSTFSHRKLKIIFDYSTVNVTTSRFDSILLSQSNLFSACSVCDLFINIFDLSEQLLHFWATNLYPNLLASFRSILLNAKTNGPVYIRPILDGCRLHSSIFWPKNEFDFARLTQPYDRCNLNGQILRVSVNNGFPYCLFRKDADGQIKTDLSTEFELLNLIKSKYNFTEQLVDSNQSWGLLVNGTWTGLIGDIYRGKTDFGLCGINKNIERMLFVDYTDIVGLDQLGWVSHKIIKKPELIFSSFSSLSIVWVLNQGFMLINFFLLVFVTRLYIGPRYFECFSSYESIYMKLWGISLRQSMLSISREQISSKRLLYAASMIGSLILANFFSSIFYSRLTIQEYERPIDTIDDLIRAASHDTHRLTILQRTSQYAAIQRAKPEDGVFYVIQKHMQRINAELINETRTGIQTLESDTKLIFLTAKGLAEARIQLYSHKQSLHISSESLMAFHFAWPMQKRSPLLRPFSLIIAKVHEAGLRRVWYQKTTQERAAQMNKKLFQIYRHETSKSIILGQGNNLTLEELRSVFMLWIVCMGLWSTVFILEILYKKFY